MTQGSPCSRTRPRQRVTRPHVYVHTCRGAHGARSCTALRVATSRQHPSCHNGREASRRPALHARQHCCRSAPRRIRWLHKRTLRHQRGSTPAASERHGARGAGLTPSPPLQWPARHYAVAANTAAAPPLRSLGKNYPRTRLVVHAPTGNVLSQHRGGFPQDSLGRCTRSACPGRMPCPSCRSHPQS